MYVFLNGADMEPERIRQTWPGARFVARGRLTPRPLGPVAAPAGAAYETWGIVLETAAGAASGEPRSAVADDGRAFPVLAASPDEGDAAAVLAAARYWELPPPYVRRLERVAAIPAEDPSDG